MKLLAAFVAAFLAGLLAGVALSWTYILSLKATIKLYRSYIHTRIDKQWDEAKKEHGPVSRRHSA
jgi:hypothetical protein